jgi:alpha-tubulin suppressor-like RCC1 family protein
MMDRASPEEASLPAPVAAIGTGRYETCAALADGTVVCWGEGTSGQLGDGSATDSAVPVLADGLTSAVEVAPAAVHVCARLGNGTVWCWGAGGSGRLGRGSTMPSNVPVQSMVVGATKLVSGGSTSCVILGDGTARCWGFNGSGGIGDNTTTDALAPVEPIGLGPVRAIMPRDVATCAVQTSGDVYCWGDNAYGQLGIGTTGGRKLVPNPVTTGSSTLGGADEVGLGIEHGCARLGGEVWCWGGNNRGQLGDGDVGPGRATAARVAGLPPVTRLAVGAYTTCALDESDGVWCWGAGDNGELGDGSTTQMRPIPTRSFTASCESN